MKRQFYILCAIIAALLPYPSVEGQSAVSGFDTVAWLRVGVFSDKYIFTYPTEREIKLKEKAADLVKYKASPVFGNIGSTALTVLTGIGFVTSSEVNWKLSAVIKCNDALPDWKIDLFCEGELEKERERVRNDDGSWSVETIKTASYFWERNSTGIIMEGSDTISMFRIILNPVMDSTLAPYAKYFFVPPEELSEKSNSRVTRFIEQYSSFRDYGISGVFRGNSFTMISDGSESLAWGFLDGHYSFKHLFDDGYRFSKNKETVDPMVLISRDTDSSNRSDFFRLAMTNQFLAKTFK